MKIISKLAMLFVSSVGLLVATGSAQSARLSASSQSLSSEGGELSIVAEVSYEKAPGALGWSVDLPEGWSFVGVNGGGAPQVGPEAGATGTLEFAYTNLPELRAAFIFAIRYPAGQSATAINSTVILRAGGKLTTLLPEPIYLKSR